MVWDSKTATRRRQSSSVGSSRAQHARQQSKQAAQPQSSHVADPFLESFLTPTFDPAEYLNASLPRLQSSGSEASARTHHDGAAPLADLSTQAQTLLSQMNAHTTRLTTTLTQLTEEILRSGSRLAYEVELLRGETLSLSEALSDGLHADIVKFVPDGIQREPSRSKSHGVDETTHARESPAVGVSSGSTGAAPEDAFATEPAYVQQLRTLTLVRSRLDSVVKTFGDAMEFVFPPSEISVSSGFLSVSAPEPGSQDHSTEQKGQQVLRQHREEISDLLSKSSDPVEGIEKAAHRIEQLKELTNVWKGTAEEKGRTKFIDALAKMVEERHRNLMREMEEATKREGKTEAEGSPKKVADGVGAESKPPSGYGIMSQLQKLRSGL